MKRIWSKAVPLIAASLAVSTLAACGSSSSKTEDDLATFRSVIFPGETYALDYIADKKGFFEDHGLKVKYLSPQSGSSAVQMLAAGEVDGWSTAPSIVYNGAAQGQPIKVGGLIPSYVVYELIIPKKADWAKPNGTFDEKVQSLKGRTIGVSGLAAGTDLALLSSLNAAGMKESDVKRIGVGTTLSGLGQLKAGSIDAYVDFTGSGARLIESDGVGQRYLSMYGPDSPKQVDALSDLGLAINSDWEKKNPKLFDAWVAALNDAREWLQDSANLEEAAKIIADASYKGKNLAEVTDSLKALSGNMARAGAGFAPPADRVDLQIDVLKKIGALKADADITSSTVILK